MDGASRLLDLVEFLRHDLESTETDGLEQDAGPVTTDEMSDGSLTPVPTVHQGEFNAVNPSVDRSALGDNNSDEDSFVSAGRAEEETESEEGDDETVQLTSQLHKRHSDDESINGEYNFGIDTTSVEVKGELEARGELEGVSLPHDRKPSDISNRRLSDILLPTFSARVDPDVTDGQQSIEGSFRFGNRKESVASFDPRKDSMSSIIPDCKVRKLSGEESLLMCDQRRESKTFFDPRKESRDTTRIDPNCSDHKESVQGSVRHDGQRKESGSTFDPRKDSISSVRIEHDTNDSQQSLVSFDGKMKESEPILDERKSKSTIRPERDSKEVAVIVQGSFRHDGSRVESGASIDPRKGSIISIMFDPRDDGASSAKRDDSVKDVWREIDIKGQANERPDELFDSDFNIEASSPEIGVSTHEQLELGVDEGSRNPGEEVTAGSDTIQKLSRDELPTRYSLDAANQTLCEGSSTLRSPRLGKKELNAFDNPVFVNTNDGTGRSVLPTDTLTLPYKQYEDWFEILRTDDSARYEETLSGVPNDVILLLTNGNFRYKFNTAMHKAKVDKVQWFEAPLVIAAIYGSKDVFQKLILDGAYIHKRDRGACNVVHALIIAANDCPKLEPNYMEIYRILMHSVRRDDCRRLLLSETIEGLQPLELAAKLETYGIFRQILETPFYYEKFIGKAGLQCFYTYNVADYEDSKDWGREVRSPLRYLASTRRRRKDMCETFGDFPAIIGWIDQKCKRNLPYLLLWFTIRFLYLIILMVVDPTIQLAAFGSCDPTKSSPVHPLCTFGNVGIMKFCRAMLMTMGYCSIFMAIYDVIDLVIFLLDVQRRRSHGFFKVQGHAIFYRLSHFILEVLTITSLFYSYGYARNVTTATANLRTLKAVSLPLIIIGFMYMMELIPVVGSFFIILQRLIMLFLKYCVILVVVGAVFVIFFFTSVSQSATGNATGIFDTFPNAIFSTFQLSIIGFSLGTIQETHVRVARCLLFFSVLLVLLSFLSSALQMLLNETDQHKTMTWRLRRLEASIAIEDRLVRWLWGILVRHLRRRREPLAVTVVKTLKGRPAFSLSLEKRRKKKDKFGSDFSLDELEVVIDEFSESKEV